MLPLRIITMSILCSLLIACNSTPKGDSTAMSKNAKPEQSATKAKQERKSASKAANKKTAILPADAVRFEMHESIHDAQFSRKTGLTYVETDLIKGSDGMYLLPGEYRLRFSSKIIDGSSVEEFTIAPGTKTAFFHIDVSPDQKSVVDWYSLNNQTSLEYNNEKLTRLCSVERFGSTLKNPKIPEYAEAACLAVEGKRPLEVDLALARIYQNDMTGRHPVSEIEQLLKANLQADSFEALYILMNLYKSNYEEQKFAALMKQHENSKEPATLLLVGSHYLESDENRKHGEKLIRKSYELGNTFAAILLADLELAKLKPDYVAAEAWLNVFKYLNLNSSKTIGNTESLINGKNLPNKAAAIAAKTEEFLKAVEPESQASLCLMGMDNSADFKGKQLTYKVNDSAPKQLESTSKPLHITNLSGRLDTSKIFVYAAANEVVWMETVEPKNSTSPHMCVVWKDPQDIAPLRYSNKNPADCTCSQ